MGQWADGWGAEERSANSLLNGAVWFRECDKCHGDRGEEHHLMAQQCIWRPILPSVLMSGPVLPTAVVAIGEANGHRPCSPETVWHRTIFCVAEGGCASLLPGFPDVCSLLFGAR